MASADRQYQTISVERQDGITWVIFNRPDKRNAMNSILNLEMLEALVELETDEATRVLVLTGAGEAWSAGQDVREDLRALGAAERSRVRRASQEWRWPRLYYFPKPTIAMVNGHCFGGAFIPLIACDVAIAADDARFGLTEINWGIPGGFVTRVLAEAVPYRDAMYAILTGEPFDGKQAAAMRLVTRSVPRAQLREETVKLARLLAEKDPRVVEAAKEVYKHAKRMNFAQAEAYTTAKFNALRATQSDVASSQQGGVRHG